MAKRNKKITYDKALQHVTLHALGLFEAFGRELTPTPPELRLILNDCLDRLGREGDYEVLKKRVESLENLRDLLNAQRSRSI